MAAPTQALASQTVDLDPDCLCPAAHGSLGTCPSPLETSSSSLQAGAYVFIGVGAVTMVMGFLGCIGAVNEVRCLLGLVSRGPEPVLAQIRRVGSSSWDGADTWAPMADCAPLSPVLRLPSADPHRTGDRRGPLLLQRRQGKQAPFCLPPSGEVR